VRSIGWMTYSAALRCLRRSPAAARPAGSPRPLTERNRGRRAVDPALPLTLVTLR